MDMEVRMPSSDAVVTLPGQVAGVVERLTQEQRTWQERLRQDPSRFGEVEVGVHHAFQEMADQVVAGLLADLGEQPQLEDACKKSC
jgi:hypothetical protein